jgi:hypothetical protein
MSLKCSLLVLIVGVLPMPSSAQRDTSSAIHIAALMCLDHTDAAGFEQLVREVGLPSPGDLPFRAGLMLYGSGASGLVMEMHYTAASDRSQGDSARATTSFVALGLSVGYAVRKTRKFELAPTIGWSSSHYGYAVEPGQGRSSGPDVSFGRNSLSVSVFGRYGQRFSLFFGATAFVPLDPGLWIDDRTGLELTEAPAINFLGNLLLGLSYRVRT